MNWYWLKMIGWRGGRPLWHARQGWSLAGFDRIHGRTRTPITAPLSVVSITAVLALKVTPEILAETTSLVLLVISCLVNGALLRLKLTNHHRRNAFNRPRRVPLCGSAVSLVAVYFVAGNLVTHWP